MESPSLPEALVTAQDISNLQISTHGRALQGSFVKGLLAISSAGLLTCSLPSPDIGWFAWIALVPLLIACDGLMPLQAATLGFLSGMAANVMTYHWVFEVKGFGTQHFVVLSTFFALYPAAWCAGISWWNSHRHSLIFAAPALWVFLDYVRAHAGFMAFPWGTIAQTQHENLAILQVATLTGEYGVTFLVVLGNMALAGIILKQAWRNAAVIGLVIALVHLGGAVALFLDRPNPTIVVAAVQPNILLGERATAAGRAAVLNRLNKLSQSTTEANPSLIVWPETAVAGSVRTNPLLAMNLSELAQEIGIPIMFGAGEVEKFASRDPQGNMQRRAYNSAYVVTPEQGLGSPYTKRVLLPFGEYVPLEDIIGWPAWLAPPTFQKVAGDQPITYTLANGIVLSPLICWENLFAKARTRISPKGSTAARAADQRWLVRAHGRANST